MRLEQQTELRKEHPQTDFNSIKVRLEHLLVVPTPFNHDDFNSIKVRLELYEKLAICICFLLFQFHKGAIRTSDS